MQRPTQNQYLARKSGGTYNLPHEDIPWYMNVGLLLSAAPVLITVIVGLVFLTASAEIAQQYVVFTGRLTREMKHPNGYRVTPDNGTQYTRLYYCMMDSGIGSDKCGDKAPVFDFQQCARAFYSCDLMADQTWPQDYGFLQCLQTNYNVSLRQTNVFMECLESTEGVMTQVFENMASTYFLGSYNYVAFLVSGLTIMSSFVVATAGGVYRGNPLNTNAHRHIKGINPLSWPCILVALVWNLGGLIWALSMAVTQKSLFGNYPVTIWTSGLLLIFFTGATGYFLTYFVEYLYDRFMPSEGKNLRSAFFQRIGVIDTDPLVTESSEDYDWRVVAPLMVRTFGWCWVFTDGLIFVGLLQPQSSPINSFVVRVFYSVTLARLFQLVSAYFANQAYINRSIGSESKFSNQTNPKEFGAHMVTLFAYLASLPLLADSLYHSWWAAKYYSEGVTTSGASVGLWLFLFLIGIGPELVRIGILLFASFYNTNVGNILFAHELLFLWDWAARALVVVIVLATTTGNLKDAQASLRDYMGLFVV